MELKNKRTRRLISIVLSVAMIFCGLTLSTLNVSAEDETSGDFTYAVNGDKVTITGYTGLGGTVTIPGEIEGKPVTVIGEDAFKSKSLTSVTIPSSVTTIEFAAFLDNKLTDVTIPSGVTTIGYYAFDSNQLTSVTIPSKVKIIPTYAFANNPLISIIIPETVTEIEECAFAFDPESGLNPTLQKAIILNKDTVFGNYVFSYATTENFKMYGYAGSTAKTYAEAVNEYKPVYTFVTLDNWLTVDAIADQAETGKAIEPTLVVKDGTTTLTEDKDYTVTFTNNVNVGTATATITGINDYKGATTTKTFKIKLPEYTFTDGTGQTITSGDDKDLTFKIDGPLELLDKVYINDEELDVANYTTASGSTIITLKKEYVSTLTAGTYTLKATYTNGASASTAFEIKAKETQTTPTNPTNPGDTTDPTNPIDTTKSPKTGDTSDMGMWIMLLVLAAGTTTVAYRKRTDK